MSRIRLLLAWLIMAALPLQGFAAASMLLCGVERGAISQPAGHGGVAHEHPDAAPTPAHDHVGHGHGSQDHADAHPGSSKTAQGQDKHGHGCPVCASCCQGVAIGGFEPFPLASPLPSAEPVSPVASVTTRAATVPDKPPRA